MNDCRPEWDTLPARVAIRVTALAGFGPAGMAALTGFGAAKVAVLWAGGLLGGFDVSPDF